MRPPGLAVENALAAVDPRDRTLQWPYKSIEKVRPLIIVSACLACRRRLAANPLEDFGRRGYLLGRQPLDTLYPILTGLNLETRLAFATIPGLQVNDHGARLVPADADEEYPL